MLINVFGIWLNPRNISYLYDGNSPGNCTIYFNSADKNTQCYIAIKDVTCDQMAAEVNKQIKEVQK